MSTFFTLSSRGFHLELTFIPFSTRLSSRSRRLHPQPPLCSSNSTPPPRLPRSCQLLPLHRNLMLELLLLVDSVAHHWNRHPLPPHRRNVRRRLGVRLPRQPRIRGLLHLVGIRIRAGVLLALVELGVEVGVDVERSLGVDSCGSEQKEADAWREEELAIGFGWILVDSSRSGKSSSSRFDLPFSSFSFADRASALSFPFFSFSSRPSSHGTTSPLLISSPRPLLSSLRLPWILLPTKDPCSPLPSSNQPSTPSSPLSGSPSMSLNSSSTTAPPLSQDPIASDRSFTSSRRSSRCFPGCCRLEGRSGSRWSQ